MRVFITGIGGFAGMVLRRELISRGHEVYGSDIVSTPFPSAIANLLDRSALAKALGTFAPDMVFHLAAISNVDSSDPGPVYAANFTGTLNLLQACSALAQKPGFLFISSSQVYGIVSPEKQPIDENTGVNPVNHYGASKAGAETAVRVFGLDQGLRYMILRPFNHTGPGQSEGFVVPKIVSAFRRSADTLELGSIDTIRDFTDVRDVAAAYASAMENFISGAVFNICSGTGISVSDIIKKLGTITGHQIRIISRNNLFRSNEITVSVGSSGAIEKQLNWRRKYSLDDTLHAMLQEKTRI